VKRSYQVLLASMLVTFVLGSVHAFSVFIVPLETLLLLPRSDISLIYSFALVAITLSVLFGYLVYARLPAWLLVLLTCLVAALGLVLAANAGNWWMLFFGYSLLFGGANGVGYGFTLQLAAREMPQNKGFAMGAVTAAYAVGSIVFASVLSAQIRSTSVAAAFMALAAGLVGCGLAAALLMYLVKANYGASYGESTVVSGQPAQPLDNRRVGLFWLAYLFSVFAGLMAIGHAAGIAISKGADTQMSVWCAMIIGIGSAIGGFLAGWLVDRWPAPRFLIGLPLLSAVSLLMLGFIVSLPVVLLLLALVGFSYGALIAIYPVSISNEFGDLGPKAYGRVFTAWGFAGLVAPWSAGLIYDLQADYRLALIVASVTAIFSAITVFFAGFEQSRVNGLSF